MKRNYMIVYSNDIATYVNAYEKGRIVGSEVFWKEDYTGESEVGEMYKNVDLSIKYFKKTYNIEKIYNEQHNKKKRK